MIPPCPKCGSAPTLESDRWHSAAWCSNCFDGALDAGPQAHVSVFKGNIAAAEEAWTEMVAEWSEEVAL